jgi:histidine triad (HIT) family protein
VSGCVFCARVDALEYDATGWDGVVRFAPLNPVTPGHMLFVPTSHVSRADESPTLTGNAFGAAAMHGAVQAEQFNLITSAGPNATQTVRHLHIHYVPRRPGDGLMLPWTGQIGDRILLLKVAGGPR